MTQWRRQQSELEIATAPSRFVRFIYQLRSMNAPGSYIRCCMAEVAAILHVDGESVRQLRGSTFLLTSLQTLKFRQAIYSREYTRNTLKLPRTPEPLPVDPKVPRRCPVLTAHRGSSSYLYALNGLGNYANCICFLLASSTLSIWKDSILRWSLRFLFMTTSCL